MDGVKLFLKPRWIKSSGNSPRGVRRLYYYLIIDEKSFWIPSFPWGDTFCALLNSKNGLTIDDIIDILWPDPDDLPEMFYNTAHSRISQTNRFHLMPYGLRIVQKKGFPYTYKIMRWNIAGGRKKRD